MALLRSLVTASRPSYPLLVLYTSEPHSLARSVLLWHISEAIDAINNGISQYPTDIKPKYRSRTDLSSRVGALNPAWNQPTDSDTVDVSRQLTDWMMLSEPLHLGFICPGFPPHWVGIFGKTKLLCQCLAPSTGPPHFVGRHEQGVRWPHWTNYSFWTIPTLEGDLDLSLNLYFHLSDIYFRNIYLSWKRSRLTRRYMSFTQMTQRRTGGFRRFLYLLKALKAVKHYLRFGGAWEMRNFQGYLRSKEAFSFMHLDLLAVRCIKPLIGLFWHQI